MGNGLGRLNQEHRWIRSGFPIGSVRIGSNISRQAVSGYESSRFQLFEFGPWVVWERGTTLVTEFSTNRFAMLRARLVRGCGVRRESRRLGIQKLWLTWGKRACLRCLRARNTSNGPIRETVGGTVEFVCLLWKYYLILKSS